jgi:phosphoserine phosphatase RsbU/P
MRNMNKKKKYRSIFGQLILNIIIPVVLALGTLAVVNYYSIKNLHEKGRERTNNDAKLYIESILRDQDENLFRISANLNEPLKKISSELQMDMYGFNDSVIENLDLRKYKLKYSTAEISPDIYIINDSGVIVNTTYKPDLGFNLYAQGESLKKYIQDVYNKNFCHEEFTTELSSKRLKKYTYEPSINSNYIIQLGVYHSEANKILRNTINKLNEYAQKNNSFVDVDLIISKDQPFSMNGDLNYNDDSLKIIEMFGAKNILSATIKEDDVRYNVDYIPVERKISDLYKNAVIRIKTDPSENIATQRRALIQYGLIFIIAILIVILLIYKKTRVITNPIQKLLQKVTIISGGDLSERAEIEGNNEITKLSEQFNDMVEKLEDYYATLENKVIERTAKITKQKEEIEEQKKDIEDSIKYAKRIQTAILPPDKYLSELFKDIFILYKPKDIVSGDFYWVNQKGNKSYIAAVDCTGHGVPGAFMSIVGNDQLNYAVHVQNKEAPGEILNELNIGVTKTLRQQKGVNTLRDGMDIALCSFDFERKELEFAGAKNNLYLLRDGVLQEIKADRHPIGAYIDEDLKEFTTQKIQLIKDDLIYIFSDGYADQFGGEKGKKFKYKNFKDLLIEIHKLQIDQQKTLLDETLINWQGDIEQLDDILVIGIKID